MLIQDQERFDATYPDAAAFLQAAALRYELYSIVVHLPLVSVWEKARLEELKKAPACNEPWFLRKLEHEFRWAP